MKPIFADEAWEDYLHWQKQDKKMVERITKLISEIKREPFAGVGKPEPLRCGRRRESAHILPTRKCCRIGTERLLGGGSNSTVSTGVLRLLHLS